ncbi:MAG: hypothetical protein ACK52M_07860 [bacterium]|jgi:hypothetical protein
MFQHGKSWRAHLNVGMALLMLPLLVLMPLLHAHPTAVPSVDHPAGLHVPFQRLQTAESPSTAVAQAWQCAPADGRGLATIVVQEATSRSADLVAMRGSAGRVGCVERPGGLVVGPLAAAVAWPPVQVERLSPTVHEHRSQAPPSV